VKELLKSIHICQSYSNKKAVLSQGNRAMPFVSVWCSPAFTTRLKTCFHYGCAALSVAIDIETSISFYLFVYYPSDSSCADQPERSWIFTAHDGVVMTSSNKLKMDSETTESFITSVERHRLYWQINVITIKISGYGVRWQWNSTSAVRSVITRLQEAQLPLRNRASAMHFFVAKLISIVVMVYYNGYHLRNLRPMIRLIGYLRTQRIKRSMRPQHLGMARDPTVVWCLLSREPLRIPAQTLYCQKPESLSYMKAAILWVHLYLILRNCFRKLRKDVHCILTFSF